MPSKNKQMNKVLKSKRPISQAKDWKSIWQPGNFIFSSVAVPDLTFRRKGRHVVPQPLLWIDLDRDANLTSSNRVNDRVIHRQVVKQHVYYKPVKRNAGKRKLNTQALRFFDISHVTRKYESCRIFTHGSGKVPYLLFEEYCYFLSLLFVGENQFYSINCYRFSPSMVKNILSHSIYLIYQHFFSPRTWRTMKG